MSAASDLHNKLGPEILVSIIKPVIEAGGSPQDVMVLLESVAAGVVTFVQANASDGLTNEQIVDLLAAGIKRRLPDIRLAALNVMGSA